jgi:DNA-binding transcriptional LysR family regulator
MSSVVVASKPHRIELRHLRAFVVVAEERHFRRAAERLGMAQPPLSVQIQTLEREVGATLLLRSRRMVELTEAGVLFLAECHVILANVERAVAMAQRAARGEQGRLEIGFTGSSSFNPFVPRIIRQFGARFPHVELALTERDTARLVTAVAARTLDVVFLRPPIEHNEDVVVEIILEEDLLVALPAGHALCGQAAVSLSELRGETFLLRPRTAGMSPSDSIVNALREAGVHRIVSRQDAPQLGSMLNLVAAGIGVSIVPASMRGHLSADIVYLPIADSFLPRAPLALAYRRGGSSAVVENFVQQVRTQAAIG